MEDGVQTGHKKQTKPAFIWNVNSAYITQVHNNSIVTSEMWLCVLECNRSLKKKKATRSSPAERSWCSRFYWAATPALKLQIHINPCNTSASYLTRRNTISVCLASTCCCPHTPSDRGALQHEALNWGSWVNASFLQQKSSLKPNYSVTFVSIIRAEMFAQICSVHWLDFKPWYWYLERWQCHKKNKKTFKSASTDQLYLVVCTLISANAAMVC